MLWSDRPQNLQLDMIFRRVKLVGLVLFGLSIVSLCTAAGQTVYVWSQWQSCPSAGTKDCPENGRMRTRQVLKGNHTQLKRACVNPVNCTAILIASTNSVCGVNVDVYGDPSGCGGRIKYPASGKYGHNEDCTWIIHAPANRAIKIGFEAFDLECCVSSTGSSCDCTYDGLQFYNGPTRDVSLLTELRGNNYLPPPISGTADSMLVRFYTESADDFNGFTFTFTFI